MGSPIKQDDDLTPEEQEQIARVEAEQQDRSRALFDKQNEEERLKQERKASAQTWLADWQQNRG